MSIKVDPSGRRWVRGEVEVPGSVEEVWRAISTEGGLSAWFTRSEFPEGADGKPTHLICYFGPGISSAAKITQWDPPRGFSVKAMSLSRAVRRYQLIGRLRRETTSRAC